MKLCVRCALIQLLSIYICFSPGYENIAKNKTTSQSSRESNPIDGSRMAVDGKIATCSSTDANNPAWWYVDLEKVKSIHDIEVYFQKYNDSLEQRQKERMYGYKLYISNSSDINRLNEAYLCYNHTGPDLPDLWKTHICVSFGQYVIFYNKRDPGVYYPGDSRNTYTQLCEVYVNGCFKDDFYGDRCFYQCPPNCKDKRCYVTDGVCPGCEDGWTGIKCMNACKPGKYGTECKSRCTDHCKNNNPCNHITGYCDGGCLPGWMGNVCNETCSSGTYGENCTTYCSGHCRNNDTCNKETGICEDGCAPGYRESKCDQKCQPGTYGRNCEKLCSGNCRENKTCNNVNGVCIDGCIAGFKGAFCNEKCESGTFGSNCSKECNEHCVNKSCHHVSGVCVDGCNPGWDNDKCDKECSEGKFGIKCKGNCSGNCRNNQTCNHIHGQCMNGCQSGFQGKKCDLHCIHGYFGENCSHLCPVNCFDICHHANGLCECEKGWRGRNCSEECLPGFYGRNCKLKCGGKCFKKEPCNIVNGSCPNGCQEHYEGDQCLRRKESAITSSSSSENNKEYIIYGVVGAVCFIIILVIVLLIRRKKGEPHTRQNSQNPQSVMFVNDEGDKMENVDQVCLPYQNAMVRMKTQDRHTGYGNIQIGDLFKRIENMSWQDNAGFKEEYKKIPKGELNACEVGKREENRVKNRYTTTFPYDHTRVTLPVSNKESDYINANYITDLTGEQRYIATQGPKKKTVVDFWKMIWQESVTTIVCLTNLKEGTKEKCTQYWPNSSDKIQHGIFAIRNKAEKTYANYVTRNFHLQNIMSKEEREVCMFHYTQWSDHGVPEAINLVVFHRHIMRYFSKNSIDQKIVVHCSAGIGRTGTFIAVDALYQNGLNSGSVNVPEYVRQMRHDRMNMIQGEDQYKMVYTALYESFRGELRPDNVETFLKKYQNNYCYENLGEIANKRPAVHDILEEFNSLKQLNTAKSSKAAHANVAANFTPEVLPIEKYRCKVFTDSDRPVYYNAVILQSFARPDGLISAQYPLESQCEDFLYLAQESRIGTVVFLGPLQDIISTQVWFPSKNDTKVVGIFTVKLVDCSPSTTVTKTNIIIKRKGYHDIPISVLECNFWRGDALTAECRKVLDAIKETRLQNNTQPNKRTLVLSRDGAQRCGPFCITHNAIEQLILDEEVDIFTATRLLQIRRPEFISTLGEYQFCHDLIAEYLQNDTVYANFSH